MKKLLLYFFLSLLTLSWVGYANQFQKALENAVQDYFQDNLTILKDHVDNLAKESQYNVILSKQSNQLNNLTEIKKSIEKENANYIKLRDRSNVIDISLKASYWLYQPLENPSNPPIGYGWLYNNTDVKGFVEGNSLDFDLYTDKKDIENLYKPGKELTQKEINQQTKDFIRTLYHYDNKFSLSSVSNQEILIKKTNFLLEKMGFSLGYQENHISWLSIILVDDYIKNQEKDGIKESIMENLKNTIRVDSRSSYTDAWYQYWNNKQILSTLNITNVKEMNRIVEFVHMSEVLKMVYGLEEYKTSFTVSNQNYPLWLSNGVIGNIKKANIVFRPDKPDNWLLYNGYSQDSEKRFLLLQILRIIE